jgi:PKD repeat protein
MINANAASYTIQSTLLWKTTQASQYQVAKDNGIVSVSDGSIVSKETPFDLQIRLDNILPQPPRDANINVYLDDQALTAIKSNLFGARIYGPKPQTLKVFIDDRKGNTTEKTWNIIFDQAPIRGELQANKATGTDPLVVSFDASTITASQPGDEIIYFSWDFDDGTVAKNVSQAKVDHTYVFNAGSGNGVFKPKVTIQTKLGFTNTFILPTPISVKRKATTVDISIPSNPTQIASV